MSSWPFTDPPNRAAITTKRIVDGSAWIAHVSHDEDDGSWQFHTSSDDDLNENDARLLTLHELYQIDPTISGIADLRPGWRAWRESRDGPWLRAPDTP